MKRVEVSEIKTSEIEDYLEGRKIGAKRFNVIRGNLINFFNWAKAANFITDNPAISVNRAIEDDAPIRVLHQFFDLPSNLQFPTFLFRLLQLSSLLYKNYVKKS